MAQSIKGLTLDLRVVSSSPTLDSALGVKPTLKNKTKQNKTKQPDAAYCVVSNKFLCLWPRSLRSSVSIPVTVACKYSS